MSKHTLVIYHKVQFWDLQQNATQGNKRLNTSKGYPLKQEHNFSSLPNIVSSTPLALLLFIRQSFIFNTGKNNHRAVYNKDLIKNPNKNENGGVGGEISTLQQLFLTFPFPNSWVLLIQTLRPYLTFLKEGLIPVFFTSGYSGSAWAVLMVATYFKGHLIIFGKLYS